MSDQNPWLQPESSRPTDDWNAAPVDEHKDPNVAEDDWYALLGEQTSSPDTVTKGWDTPQSQPAEALRVRGEHKKQPSFTRKVALRIGVATLAASVVAGAAAGANAFIHSHDHASASSSPEATPPFDTFAELPPIDPSVEKDIEMAISMDTCETKVSVEDVTTMYRRLFGETKMPSNLKELESQTDITVGRLEAATKQLHFVPLSPAVSKMQYDWYNAAEKVASYAVLKKEFSDYVGKFGIDFIDSWNDKTQINSNLTGAQLSDSTVKLTAAQLEASMPSRVQLMKAMEGLSKMPKEVVMESGVKHIAIGDLDPSAGAIALPGRQTIVLNVDAPRGQKQLPYYQLAAAYSPDLIGHEITHIDDSALCAGIFGDYYGDSAYTYFNKGFVYGNRPKKLFYEHRLPKSGYTTIDAGMAGHPAAVLEAYGATDELEDKATVRAPLMLNGPDTTMFSQPEGVDPTIVYEKTALLMARIAAKNPDVAEYYVQLAQASQLNEMVKTVSEPVYDAYFKTTIDVSRTDTDGSVDDDPRIIAGKAKLQPYIDLYHRLNEARFHTVDYQNGEFMK